MRYLLGKNYLDIIQGGRYTNRTSQTVLEIRNTFVKYFKG